MRISKLIVPIVISLSLFGCGQERRQADFNLSGETVRIAVDDIHMKILNGRNVIAEITITSNAYFVTIMADGNISLVAHYDKSSETPRLVNRFVTRQETTYILTYDENGHVISETEVGKKPEIRE